MKRRLFAGAAALAVAASSLILQPSVAQAAPPVEACQVKYAKSAILIDQVTGQVLCEKNADEVLAPASLTKIITMGVTLEKVREGAIHLNDRVTIREDAWAAKWPGSSLMFLEPGQKVTLDELLLGLAVASGNDAATAIADHVSGSVSGFVSVMNQTVAEMGFAHMKFVDPAGLDPKNQITAREFAQFARLYLQHNPDAIKKYHSVQEIAFPKWENLSPERQATATKEKYQPIVQFNRNGLLGQMGIDGLKTGFIEEAGYNIALTAQQGDMRLIAVVLGVQGANTLEGSQRREEDGMTLLKYGFDNFRTVKPNLPAAKPVRVYKGAAKEVALEPVGPVTLTVKKGQEVNLTTTVHQESSVIAPVKKGAKLGEVIFSADGKEIGRIDLVAAQDVNQGGIFRRLWDGLILWIQGLLSKIKK
jgi:D-alanyl-D-alanine carboxypeptidase (penicillin-binding protein 5/6)